MIDIIAIGLLLSPIPAAMAFLITYEEYSHHGMDRSAVVGRATEAAIVTLLFFAALAGAMGFLLPVLLVPR